MFEIVLRNDVTIHHLNDETIKAFSSLIDEYSSLWKNIDFVKLSEKNWMKISLKFDWKNKISDKARVYSLSRKNKKLVNQTFNKLHKIDKLDWTIDFIFFNYSIFCVWKMINEKSKKRVVVDVRDLNVITQSNVYSLSLQFSIISIVLKC